MTFQPAVKDFRLALCLALVLAIPGTPLARDTIQNPLAPREQERSDRTPATRPPPPSESRVRFQELWRVPLGSPLSGSLLALEDRVVASVEGGGVQAASLVDGRLLWRADLGEPLSGGPVEISGLIAQATAAGRVVALEPAGGARRWTTNLEREIRQQPTVVQDTLLVPLATGQIVSLDSEGRERWRVDLRGAPSTPAAPCRDMALVGTEAGTVEAFERKTGRRLWTSDIGSPPRSPLLCSGKSIYFGTDDNRLRALRLSGRRRWSYRVGGAITSLPIAFAKRLYFLSYDNYAYVLKARSGHLLLRVRMSHRLSDGALRDDARLYLSPYTSARLLALTLPDLQLIGEYRLDLEGEWFTTSPVRSGDRLLIGYGRYEGRILALKEEKEEPRVAPPAP